MARWEPDARGRLDQAAMALFRERGFSETTVAEIAARAGLTERTFFRYYADKREVFFWGAKRLEGFVVERITAAQGETAAIEIVADALAATSEFFDGRREWARIRQAIILAHAELREREVMKLTSMAGAMTDALVARGVPEPTASLSGEAGVAIFKIGFQRWLEDRRSRGFGHHVRAALVELRAAIGAERAAAPRARPPRRRTTTRR